MDNSPGGGKIHFNIMYIIIIFIIIIIIKATCRKRYDNNSNYDIRVTID